MLKNFTADDYIPDAEKNPELPPKPSVQTHEVHSLTPLHHLGANIGELLKRFTEKSQDVFWIRSPDYSEQIYISPSYESIWGRPCRTLYVQPELWIETVHPDDRSLLENSIAKRRPDLHNELTFRTEYRCVRPDGDIRWIRDESFALYDDDGNHIGFAGIAQDISQEKELEHAKELAKIANQSKSEFLANMSHDLRTPLNWLLGAADILNKRNTDPSKTKLIEMILDGGKRILHMVEEILDYSKLESGKLPLYREPLNFRQILEEVISMLMSDAQQKSLEIIVDYPDTVCRQVMGDVQRLRRIIMNLVSNAIKFTHEGYILVKIREHAKVNDHVQLEMSIEDTGIGIPEEKMATIFERFERVEPAQHGKYKGVGLGLAIVKKFVEAMGGRVAVESIPAKGSIFTCQLPLARQNRKEKPLFWHLHCQHLKLLIVDDNLARAKSYYHALSAKTPQIINSSHALDYIVQEYSQHQPFDIILVDDTLTEVSALDLAEQIISLDIKHPPLLVLTTQSTTDQTIITARDHGYHHVLHKPMMPTELASCMGNIWLSYEQQHMNPIQLVQKIQPHILLVEDEPFGQKIVSLFLEEELGCRVTLANNAEEAFSIHQQLSFDLILMDIGLPDDSGLNLTKRIRKTEDPSASTPIVALTANASDEIMIECQSVGMNGYVSKPASTEDLLAVIEAHVLQLSTAL